MRQVQFTYEDPKKLKDILRRIARFRGDKAQKLLFHIYSEQSNFVQINAVCNAIVEAIPDAMCVGSSCNGSVVGADLSSGSVTVGCTLFERESTQVEIMHYGLNDDCAEVVAEDLVNEIEKRPWVTALELLSATQGASYSVFCKGLSSLRRDVTVFGGMAGQASEECSSYVLSSICGYSDESVVCVLYGGPDFHAESVKVSGWKPLGRPFTVTKAQGNVLLELDGRPAFEAYSKYLNIQNDYYFLYNTLEFPLFYNEDNEYLLRSPMACSEDGALRLASNLRVGSTTRITYGDPPSIMDGVKWAAVKLSEFCPDIIHMFSCVARRSFWGDSDIGKEISPFNTIAPTFGFFGGGQFLRARDKVKLQNVTIVLAAMREGDVNPQRVRKAVVSDCARAGKVSVISRLANFTNVSSAELMEMYNMMTKNSITDALTGLYNRGEIQRRIVERFAECPNEKMSLVMIDIDNFKSVNDTFGHKEGDNVIVGLSKQIQMTTFENAPDADAGRWGGEEFMIMLPDAGLKEAIEFAEAVRVGFSQVEFPAVGKKTISLGVTEMNRNDTSDSICVRVDKALYEAKRSGKNKVVVL